MSFLVYLYLDWGEDYRRGGVGGFFLCWVGEMGKVLIVSFFFFSFSEEEKEAKRGTFLEVLGSFADCGRRQGTLSL